MDNRKEYFRQPSDEDLEKASNSYVMSLLFIMGGLPLPIVNLIGTVIFFLANLKANFFVRWHCLQALLSQLVLVPFNSFAFWWTISLFISDEVITSRYIAYIVFVVILNFVEFLGTIYAAVSVRKGKHVKFWLLGEITDQICKKNEIAIRAKAHTKRK